MVKRVVITYDNSAIEPYENRAWIDSKMSGRNPPLYCTNTFPKCSQIGSTNSIITTVILYTNNINRHVGTPKQNKEQYQTR